MSMPIGGQSLAPAENVGRGFLLRSAPPAERAVFQPHQVEMPVQGVMSGQKSSNPPGLFPTEGQELGPSTPIRPRDQLPSLSLGGETWCYCMCRIPLPNWSVTHLP
jgi:hypothetical protein